MKKLFFLIFSLVSIVSCDDGDIIVTSFEFDDVALQVCSGAEENEFVFFKINPTNNEAISFNFIGPYQENVVSEMPINIDLATGESNGLIYRKFNVTVTSDYYCANIPSSSIRVTDELIATSGNAAITTEIVAEDDQDGVDPIEESGGIDPTADIDDDGIPNYQDSTANGSGTTPECPDVNGDGICDTLEKIFDADGDGLPNFKDQDDDNDNVLTSAELGNLTANNNVFQDTDGDMIPDYLDDDDDGDMIPTINEDLTVNADGSIGNNNPRDDDSDEDGIDNYLDADSTERNDTATPSLANSTVRTTFRTIIRITNMMFDGNEQNFENDIFGTRDVEVTRNLLE
ncbi:hypothetical protein [Aquimarina aggregata]|uniref:hypothetical protein n=1 Tax=Aquimarina aggregata TaxID=1642818 RepID=UPI000A547173|nr:hypothetical protein [Aquimarina aggregata]